MNDNLTPADVAKRIPLGCLITVLSVAFIALVVGFFTHFGFWLDNQNQQHQVHVRQIQASAYNNNVGVQQSDIQAMETAIGDIDDSDPAHAALDARTACGWASKIISIPPGDAAWVKANCLAGNLSPDSKYGK